MSTLNGTPAIALPRHIREYWAFVRWLFGDLGQYRRSIFAANISSILAVIGHLVSFATVYWYISKMRNEQLIVLGGVVLGHANDPLPFSATVLVIGILTIGAVMLDYFARREAIRLASRYGEYCEKRAYVLISRQDLATNGTLPAGDPELRTMLREAKMAGIAARLVTLGIANIISFPIGLSVLLLIDPMLCVIVGSIFLSGSIGYYRISVSTANARATAVRLARDANLERKTLASRALKYQAPLHWSDTELFRFYTEGATAKVGLALEQQRTAIERSALVSNLVIAVGLIVIFLVGGISAMERGTGWEALLMFLLVMRQIGSRLVAAMRTIIALNRFYPGLKRYAETIKQLQGQGDVTAFGSVSSGIQVNCKNGSNVQLQPNEIAALIQADPLERADALRLSQQSFSLGEPSRHARFALLAAGPVRSLSSIREAFDLGSDATSTNLAEKLRRLGAEDLMGSVPEIDSAFDGRKTNTLDPALASVLNLMRAMDHGYDGVLMDSSSLRLLSASQKDRLLLAIRRSGLVAIIAGARVDSETKGLANYVFFGDGEVITTALPAKDVGNNHPMIQKMDRVRRARREVVLTDFFDHDDDL